MLYLQILVNGLLLGGLYACIASGFSLVWGVLNVINILHGSFIVIGSLCWAAGASAVWHQPVSHGAGRGAHPLRVRIRAAARRDQSCRRPTRSGHAYADVRARTSGQQYTDPRLLG